MKFIADTMLGTLARWLRVLGFDTLYAAGMDDDAILKLAVTEGRTILSRDKGLCARKPDSILIDSTDLDSQIVQVLESYPAVEDDLLSRCLECNTPLVQMRRDDVEKESLPEGLWARYEEYWHCGKCRKYYWPGSHFENMKMKADQLMGSHSSK